MGGRGQDRTRRGSRYLKFPGQAFAEAGLLRPHHAGDQEVIDSQPDQAGKHTVQDDLKDRAAGTAEIEAMSGKDAEEEPKDIGEEYARPFIGDALLDQDLLLDRRCPVSCPPTCPVKLGTG